LIRLCPQLLLWNGRRAVSIKSVIHGLSASIAWLRWNFRCPSVTKLSWSQVLSWFWHFSLFMPLLPLNRQARFLRFFGKIFREMNAWRCKNGKIVNYEAAVGGYLARPALPRRNGPARRQIRILRERVKETANIPKHFDDKNKNCVNYQRNVDKSVSYWILYDNEL